MRLRSIMRQMLFSNVMNLSVGCSVNTSNNSNAFNTCNAPRPRSTYQSKSAAPALSISYNSLRDRIMKVIKFIRIIRDVRIPGNWFHVEACFNA